MVTISSDIQKWKWDGQPIAFRRSRWCNFLFKMCLVE